MELSSSPGSFNRRNSRWKELQRRTRQNETDGIVLDELCFSHCRDNPVPQAVNYLNRTPNIERSTSNTPTSNEPYETPLGVRAWMLVFYVRFGFRPCPYRCS